MPGLTVDDAESVAAEVKELGRNALSVLADVGNRKELEQLLDKAMGEFGTPGHSHQQRLRSAPQALYGNEL